MIQMTQNQQSVQDKFSQDVVQDQVKQGLFLHMILKVMETVDADEFTGRPLGKVGSAEAVALLVVRTGAAGAVYREGLPILQQVEVPGSVGPQPGGE